MRKCDPSDSLLLMDLGRTHGHKLRARQPLDPLSQKRATLVEARRGLIDLRVGLSSRLKQALKDTFPQALAMVGDELFTTPWLPTSSLSQAVACYTRPSSSLHRRASSSAGGPEPTTTHRGLLESVTVRKYGLSHSSGYESCSPVGRTTNFTTTLGAQAEGTIPGQKFSGTLILRIKLTNRASETVRAKEP